MRFLKTVPLLLPGIKFVTLSFISLKRRNFQSSPRGAAEAAGGGSRLPPSTRGPWGTHPPPSGRPALAFLSWANEGPGRGAFFSLPGALSRQERGPRASVGSRTAVGEEACRRSPGTSLSPGPPLSCPLCVAPVTREESLACHCFSPVAQASLGRLVSSPAGHARMTPVASLSLFPEIQTRVPKWLGGIRARRRRPLGARPDLRSCPTARASCWGAVCSQARGPCRLTRAVGPSSSPPLSPLLSQPLLPEPRPQLCSLPSGFPPAPTPSSLRLSGGLHTVGSSRTPLTGSPIFPSTRPSPPAGIRRASRPCAQGRGWKQTDLGPESRTSVSSSAEWHGQVCLGGPWGSHGRRAGVFS